MAIHKKVSGWGKMGPSLPSEKGKKSEKLIPGLPGKTIRKKEYVGPATAQGSFEKS